MAGEAIAMNCIHGDGTDELDISVCFLRMSVDRGIGWSKAAPSTPQSNGIAERAIQGRMVIASSKLEKSGRGGELQMFTVADAVFKIFGTPHQEYLGD